MVDLKRGPATSEAVAINDKGQVVGTRRVRQYSAPHALLWQSGEETELGTLGGKESRPAAINERGQIVGTSRTASGDSHAFLWQNGRMTDLGTLPGGRFSRAIALNERGQTVGESYTANWDPHAVLWQDGIVVDLGARGRPWSWAEAINERGQIVGIRSSGSDYIPAFVWRNGNVTHLGSVSGSHSGCYGIPPYSAINDRGQVAYTAIANARSGDCHAFVWENGKATDLGTVNGRSSYAVGINERGQIVGGSETQPGQWHAVLWTPQSDS
jgi:probable HAF family extracellular repeat protein